MVDVLTKQKKHEVEEHEERRLPPGIRHVARWVRLCEVQGTRLVDLIERWVDAAEEHNAQAARLADAAERLAGHADDYLGYDEGEEHEQQE